ncbi:hypothetical protein GDO81_004204 [Engystomops pustulosus]|uniref:Secreted protein n=1 Tax=Engystomops pustulosus TaxID=76066 RepID=A0AAV6ZW05_ENGPU|nr:hypothetical protein GDO81_004204 [Engystomops pustulosus]
MLRCVTLLLFLSITWTQQAGSNICGNRPTSKEHAEVYSLLQKSEAAINQILDSDKLRKAVQDVNKIFMSKLCEIDVDPEVVSVFKTVTENFIQQIQDGSVTQETIVSILNNDPIKALDPILEKMKKGGKRAN